MKRKTSKEILTESFRELAKDRNVDKITVKDITENCGYSPATFYRQFKDKYDLIAWDYARHTSQIMGQIGTDDYEWKQTLLDGARGFQREKPYLINLLKHTSGHDSFIQYMTEINCRELTTYIQRATGNENIDQEMEMYIRIYCMGTVCLTCEWILGKYKAAPEEIARIYENSVPLPLRPLLLKD